MISSLDYSDLLISQNGIVSHPTKVIANNTEIDRLKVNGTDFIHKTNRYNGDFHFHFEITVEIKYNNYGGCNSRYDVTGSLKIQAKDDYISGDLLNATLISAHTTANCFLTLRSSARFSLSENLLDIPAGTNLLDYHQSFNLSGEGDLLSKMEILFSAPIEVITRALLTTGKSQERTTEVDISSVKEVNSNPSTITWNENRLNSFEETEKIY